MLSRWQEGALLLWSRGLGTRGEAMEEARMEQVRVGHIVVLLQRGASVVYVSALARLCRQWTKLETGRCCDG